MYLDTYTEIASDNQAQSRRREYEAFDSVVAMLESAGAAGAGSRQMHDALDRMETLWTLLLDDLSDPHNSLSEDLRARLISIGLWIIRRANDMRLTADGDVSGLVAVNSNIRDGLR